ncbi:MAG: T9SS type A sorting domain-containing protein [Psychroserpens sp.]|nr:T9SS type A sorting domain-containing protein [Psychroserpens sp.]
MKRILLFILVASPFLSMNAQAFDWAKSIGGTGTESVNAVAKNPTGIFITGTFQGTVDFNAGVGVNNLTSNGGTDCFILKTDFDGNYLWAISFGGSGNDEAVSIVADNSGLILGGHFFNTVDFNPGTGTNFSTSNGSSDLFYLKLNNSGNYIYHKVIGGTGADICNKVAFDNVLIPYLSGTYRNTVDFNPDAGVNNLTTTGANAFVMKINPSNGGFIWVKDFNAINNGTAESYASGLDFDSSGSIYVGGNYTGDVDFNPGVPEFANTSSGGTKDSFLVKLDNSGTFVWAAFLQNSNDNMITDLVVDGDNNLVMVGNYKGIIDFNPGSPFLFLDSDFREVTFIWKLDVNKNFIVAGRFESGGANYSNAVEIDVDNNIYIAGKFRGGMDLDISNGSNVINSSNATIHDAYLVKLNANNLGHIYSKQLASASSSEDEINEIMINNSNIYTFGVYEGTIDLNPDPPFQNATSNGDYDFFIQRFTDNSLGTDDFSTTNFKIYPNPTSNDLYIETFLATDFKYQIISIDGKVMQYGNGQLNNNPIDVSKLASGMYLLELKSENQRTVQKFIKD